MGGNVERAEHWAKLFKIIRREKTKGIALFDLADELELERDDAGLAKGIEQLRRQGKIRTALGRAKDGKVCLVVQPAEDDTADNKRTRVLQDKEPESELERVDGRRDT